MHCNVYGIRDPEIVCTSAVIDAIVRIISGTASYEDDQSQRCQHGVCIGQLTRAFCRVRPDRKGAEIAREENSTIPAQI